jgi:Tfp pilus assembly protein PilF
VKSRIPLSSFCIAMIPFMVLGFLSQALGQTYDVGGGSPSSSSKQADKKSQGDAPQSGPDFSWGSGIDVARQARAAQDALKKNDYSAAVSYAEQAAKSAPQNTEMWFLLGYTARLAERYQLSIDSYNRGLKLQPNSVRGLAGLAQTYAKMGRDQDAEQLLRRVVEANPKDANSLQLAGELMLSSDPKAALGLLQRAETLQPTVHGDLLIAHAYDRLGQPEDSAHYLNRARSRAPHDSDVLRAVAGQYRDQGKYDDAIATLQAVSTKTTDVWAELAYTYQLAGKQQEAAALYSRLAKAAKGNISLELSAAQAWVNVGQPDAARPFLEAARKIDGNNYRLHAILASNADSDDRLQEAGDEYRLALNNLPTHPQEGPLYPVELRLNLYEITVRQDDAAGAKQELEAATSALQQIQVADSARPEMLRLRAVVESASGDLDTANRDLKEALALSPGNVNSLMNLGSLLWKMGQKDAARDTFTKILELDHNNRQALSSLGYLARDTGDTKLAEIYFTRAIAAHSKDYAPYLALGDLYTAERKFQPAESSYESAFQRMPGNPQIIAGGANAALESHNMSQAQHWLERASAKANTSPQVMRERERYLTFKGDYVASAKLGYEVVEKLPSDREGAVYLAYDLYYLGRYDEALALVTKYEPILANDKDLPLIAGNVHAHNGDLNVALKDFTLALERDPKMATGYVNRGFVLNDLRQPGRAAKDFQTALQLQNNYGEAHLGLAFADLQLHRPKPALTQLDAAQKILGKSHAWHVAKAEGFRQEQDFAHAATEYRAALTETPNDLTTQLAYADVLYRMRRYTDAISALNTASQLSPSNPAIFALMAQVHARQGDREQTLRDLQSAEQLGGSSVAILTATGDALLTLGDRNAAMQRFSRALDVPGGDRIGVRLAVADIFLRQGHLDEARRQIALGFAEACLDSDSSVTAEDLAQAANLFLAMHDFDLAESYFDKAKLAGVNQRTVEIGLTNTYLAEGNTRKAEAALASLGSVNEFRDDYDYMMASANLYRQRQDPLHALSAFAQASTVAGEQDHGIAESSQYVAADQEGRQILNDKLSIVPEGSFAPVLEDINVYALDAKILGVTNPALLPPPRHSYQSLAETHYRVLLGNLPAITGFVGEGMTAGQLLFPSVGLVQDRNTYDTILNGGISPVLHLGSNSITFNGGLQFTVRRDTLSPVFMNQNLFRQFLYMSTSSFFNWISVTGSAVHETGPFTEQNLHSRDDSANLEFTVGRPWGSTSLITGYSARDLLFRPLVEEYFNTSSYVGLQHHFGRRLTAAVLAEDLRSWRVQNTQYAIAQALLPGGRFDFRANARWSVQGSFILSRGVGYHAYDNAQSEFLVSYVRPIHGSVRDGISEVPVAYPMRFSFGVQQQTFYDFPGSGRTTVLPIVHFTLF